MPGQNYNETIISSGNNPFNIKLLIGLLVVLLLAGVGMGYYLYSRGAISLPFVSSPVPTSKPQQLGGEQPNIDYNFQLACDASKDGKLIIAVTDVLDNLRSIAIHGTISQINHDSDNTSILLTSSNGDISVPINLKNVPNLVYEADTEKEISLNDLKFADTVLIDYNCNQQSNSNPVIVRIRKTTVPPPTSL